MTTSEPGPGIRPGAADDVGVPEVRRALLLKSGASVGSSFTASGLRSSAPRGSSASARPGRARAPSCSDCPSRDRCLELRDRAGVPPAGTHYITNRNDNRFELTNPTGFNEWLDTQNRGAGGHLVHVIRLMKFLRDSKRTFGVKSVILTTLLGERVNSALTLADPKYYGDLPTALYRIVRDLDAYLQGNWFLPVLTDPSCPRENFNHRWDQDGYANFREKIHFYAAKISAASRSSRPLTIGSGEAPRPGDEEGAQPRSRPSEPYGVRH